MNLGSFSSWIVLDVGVLARDHADAGVEIGPGEGDAHRPVRRDRGGAQAEIDLARERRRKAPVGLDTTNSTFFGIAQQILGDLVRHVDLETDQLALVVDIGERRRRAVGADDQLVALQDDIELRFLRQRRNREAGKRKRQQNAISHL